MKTLIFTLALLFVTPTLTKADEQKVVTSLSSEKKSINQYPHRPPINVLSQPSCERIIKLAKEVAFSDDRYRLLEAALTERYLTAAQCIRFLRLADFDDERLKILSFIGSRIVDRENIIDIIELFSFSDDQAKAKKILQFKR